MTLARIQRDVMCAQQRFDFVEAHHASDGRVMVLVALQTVRRIYTLAVYFPDTYPNSMPTVFVRKPALKPSLHRFPHNQICYLLPNMWNPGRHDLIFVIARAAKWLSKYEIYLATGRWPGAGIDH